jgi:hypothetical protein
MLSEMLKSAATAILINMPFVHIAASFSFSLLMAG